MKNQKPYRVELTQGYCKTHGAEKEVTYGIYLQRGDRDIKIEDISPNKQAVLLLIDRLQRNPVDPEILPEIVDDFLTEVYAI